MLRKIIYPYPKKEQLTPYRRFLNGASIGFMILSMLTFSIGAYFARSDIHPFIMGLLGGISGMIFYLLGFQILSIANKYRNIIPAQMIVILGAVVVALFIAKNSIFSWPSRPYQIAILIGTILSSMIGGGIAVFKSNRLTSILTILAGALGLILGMYWLLQPGNDPYSKESEDFLFDETVESFADQGLKDPSSMGEFDIEHLIYGSGDNLKREEFGRKADLISEKVDARKLIPAWKGKHKKWREKYWEFGPDSFPLNGRINLPTAEGKFPLVLVVHGNHNMNDYSDEGYEYLNKVLASKGMIAVSVDENFINGHWSGDFRGKEMPARAWLLLKHIEQFKTWNFTKGHALEGKVDLDNIMLVGHSRGGEAVSIAAAYNKLDYYPDDASEKFDFNFKIKGIVSIAPTDYRYHRKISLEDLNYLSIQGSYDSDESSFWGFRPYQRLQFSEGQSHFKAAVLIDKANHGQFNTTWDRSDMGKPMAWLLNLEPILQRKDQEKVALVFISAFAEATLKDNEKYLPIFNNVHLAQDWLPPNIYISNFQSGQFKKIANFEEDINLSTLSHPKFVVQVSNHKVWREEELSTRDGGKQDNSALVLGWDYGEEIKLDSILEYKLHSIDSSGLDIRTFNFSVAQGDVKAIVKKDQAWAEPRIDFTVELETNKGRKVKTKASDIKPISPRLKVKYAKEKSMNNRFGKNWEAQLETFTFPVTLEESERVVSVRFLFDQTTCGLVYLDDIGYE